MRSEKASFGGGSGWWCMGTGGDLTLKGGIVRELNQLNLPGLRNW